MRFLFLLVGRFFEETRVVFQCCKGRESDGDVRARIQQRLLATGNNKIYNPGEGNFYVLLDQA